LQLKSAFLQTELE
jgi:stearoyl-CoA desaturase (Delta-9 desaturase)